MIMHRSIMTAGLISAALLVIPALANAQTSTDQANANLADSPNTSAFIQPEESWIAISGKAVDAEEARFTLDYGSGKVAVEMADQRWYYENNDVLEGKRVTVYGQVEDETYDSATIDARSVYVEDLGTYFYTDPGANGSPDPSLDIRPESTITEGSMSLTGTIASIQNNTFKLATGSRQMTVDISELDYDPFSEGYQHLEVGDVVTVAGTIGEGTFKHRKLTAETIVAISNQPAPSLKLNRTVVPPGQ